VELFKLITIKRGNNEMKKYFLILFLYFLFILMAWNIAHAQKDAEGCKDHPLFTRMPNFYLSDCEEKDFDKAEFRDEKGKTIEVEGKLHRADYWIREGYKAPSDLHILRNFQNAIKKIGGVVVKELLNFNETYLKLSKGGKRYWVIVDTSNNGQHYELTIVEKAEMAQEIVADAKSLMSDISATGHASVYGIYFDFDKADIKPESEPAINEISVAPDIYLLREDNSLQPISSGIVPWKSNTTGPISEELFNVLLTSIPEELYYFYLVVTPAGELTANSKEKKNVSRIVNKEISDAEEEEDFFCIFL
jgi:hypothetical protein